MIKNKLWVSLGVSLAFCLSVQAEFIRFLGGSEWDYARDAVMDASGQVVVVGGTWSHDFPNQSYRSLRSGSDGFLSVLDASGSVLASHFIGGRERDEIKAIIPLDDTRFLLVGQTDSVDFPLHNPIQKKHAGYRDVFVVEWSLTEGVIFSTFLGGNGDDRVQAVAFSNQRIYLVGRTRSTNFPGVHGRLGVGGMDDGFLAVIDVENTPKLQFSVLIGGQSNDVINALVIAEDGRVIVAGHTDSADFPQKRSEKAMLAGRNAFVAEMSQEDWQFSIVLGGRGDDSATALGLDGEGMLLLAGVTASSDFPLRNGVQMAHAGSTDGFVMRLSPDAKVVLYSTLLGGKNQDEITAMHVDSSGYATVTGFTQSADFPTTQEGVFQNESTDAFVSQLGVSGGFLNYSLRFGGLGGEIGEAVFVRDEHVVLVGKSWSDQWRFNANIDSSGLWDAFIVVVDEATLTGSKGLSEVLSWKEKSLSSLDPVNGSVTANSLVLPARVDDLVSVLEKSSQQSSIKTINSRPLAYSQGLKVGVNETCLLRLQGISSSRAVLTTVSIEPQSTLQGKLTLLDGSLGMFRYQSPNKSGRDQVYFRVHDEMSLASEIAVVDIQINQRLEVKETTQVIRSESQDSTVLVTESVD